MKTIPSALLLALLAFLPRVYAIGSESLSADEIFSHRIANLPLERLLAAVEADRQPQPLYYVAAKLFVRATGCDAAGLRIFSALCGAAAAVAAAFAALRLWGRGAYFAAGVFAAFSAPSIAVSQMARPYALLALLGVLSWTFLLEDIRRPRPGVWLGFALSTLAAWYTHPHAFLNTAAQGVCFIVFRAMGAIPAASATRVWAAWALAAAGFAPWAWNFYAHCGELVGMSRMPDWPLEAPDAREFVRTMSLFAGAFPASVVVWELATLGLYRTAAADRGAFGALAAWIFFPALGAWAASVFFFPIYHWTYLVAGSFAVMAAASWGFMSLRSRSARAAVAAALIFLSAPVYASYYGKHQGVDWRKASAQLEARFRPGDALFVVPADQREALAYHLRGVGAREAASALRGAGPQDAALDEALKASARTWIVFARPKEHGRATALRRRFRESHEVHESSATALKICLFERSGGEGGGA